MPAVELVLPIDVGRMERQAHLLHPVLGGDPQIHSRLQPGFDHRIRQTLGAGVEADVGRLLLHDLENASPERFLLARFQAGLVVHAKLDGVHLGHTAE